MQRLEESLKELENTAFTAQEDYREQIKTSAELCGSLEAQLREQRQLTDKQMNLCLYHAFLNTLGLRNSHTSDPEKENDCRHMLNQVRKCG